MSDTSRDHHTGHLPADPPRTGLDQAPASSYVSQGPGWWQASDHKWYPPEHHPAHVAPEPSSPGTTPPSTWDALRPHMDKALPHIATGRRLWSGLPPGRRIMVGGAAALAVVTAVAAPLTAYHYFFAGPSLPPEQQFVHDVAAAGIVSADPAVRAGINLPASAISTATIISLATAACADLNNGTSKDAEAIRLYQGALEGTLTGGASPPHDKAVKIVDLAVQDVCPGK